MENLEHILRAKQKLKMDLAQWDRFRQMPGWVQDKHIAADYFQRPDLPFDIAEIIIDEPVAWEKTNKYYISLLLDGEQARPMELELEHGQGRFLRPNQPGSMIFSDGMRDKTFLGRGPYQVISLAVDRPFLHSRVQELFDGTPDDLASLLTSPHHDIVCEESIKRLMSICRTPGNQFAKDELLDTIISRLWSKTGRTTKRSTRTSLKSMSVTAIDDVIEYMKSNLASDLGREDLARIAQVSTGHFSRLFNSTTGQTPKRYLLTLRLEKAQQLLKQDHSLSVNEISRLCGFTDQANFYHAFRDHSGCSPAKFREAS